MRQLSWRLTGFILFSLPCLSLHAQQTPIDYLDKELEQVQQQHQEMTAQALANFFSQLDQARANPEVALELYKTAGGAMPAATAVTSLHDHESQRERAERESQDSAKAASLAVVAQLQCGLMRYGGAFIATPDQPGLHDSWIAWLKVVPQTYLQVPDNASKEARELKNKTLRESAITNYLTFKRWGDKEQGTWTVKDIPKLYRAEILEPLRATPSGNTLAAWDVYISLKQADQSNPDRWKDNDYPPLAFERACDDYAISGSMEKLQAVVQIIKANPNLPKLDDLITRTKGLVADYRTRHGSANTVANPSTPPPPVDPNVSVHTEGDMTVITTRSTNAAPVTPSPQ